MNRCAGNSLLTALARDLQRLGHAEAVQRAKEDPAENKLTLAFEGDMRWRYFEAGTDGRGWKVRFAWSTTRNAAGYFLGWRELVPPPKSKAKFLLKRDQFIARKARHRCKAKARERLNKFRESNAG